MRGPRVYASFGISLGKLIGVIITCIFYSDQIPITWEFFVALGFFVLFGFLIFIAVMKAPQSRLFVYVVFPGLLMVGPFVIYIFTGYNSPRFWEGLPILFYVWILIELIGFASYLIERFRTRSS